MSWTFGQKVGGGFALIVALGIALATVGIYALRMTIDSSEKVIAMNARNLIDAERLRAALEARVSANRGFLLMRDESFAEQLRASREESRATLARLEANAENEAGARLVANVGELEQAYQDAIDAVVEMRRADEPLETVLHTFDAQVLPRRRALDAQLDTLRELHAMRMAAGREAATRVASSAVTTLVIVSVVIVLLAIGAAAWLTQTLRKQIGSAVLHVQSSSSELQTAANQQASGAKEQASAMSEITMTITELLATSKQIAESAQRVTQIADDTVQSALSGQSTVSKTTDSMDGIKRQVDLIVAHMLDLGKKSQQIGGILEIINELAEQTNILAINATIEAAGAGESGRRFGVVADEIRKLADRVASSTREIRTLIDDVRAAVNTTVMTTESGAKAVDAGTRMFAEVSDAFGRISALVTTTTEAAREIELSTKQQATAVEQVNLAVANVAQATRETEASSSQTYQTASQLTTLSRGLSNLIQRRASA